MTIDELETENKALQEKLDIAIKGLELAKGFYGYCKIKQYPCCETSDFKDDIQTIDEILEKIKENE